MSDDKPNPLSDLKEGLGLLFRAAKGAVDKLPTDKLEDVAKDAAKEMTRALETLGHEVEKVFNPGKAGPPPPEASAAPPAPEPPPPAPPEPHYDDAYAPEPPKGPRVG